MDLHWLARNAVFAQRTRKRMKRTGLNGNNRHPLWTKAEDDTIRRLYPDYKALRRLLKRRTEWAIKRRAGVIGVRKKSYQWTAAGVSRLRRLYPTGTHAEILAAFPGLTWMQIKDKGKHLKIYRARKPPRPSGYPILQAVRMRAYELNLSMVDLDALAKSKTYFRVSCHKRSVDPRAIFRAIEALDGEIKVVWR